MQLQPFIQLVLPVGLVGNSFAKVCVFSSSRNKACVIRKVKQKKCLPFWQKVPVPGRLPVIVQEFEHKLLLLVNNLSELK